MLPVIEIFPYGMATVYVELVDATTGAPKTAVAVGDLTVRYNLNRGASATLAMEAIASVGADIAGTGHVTGGWVEVDATNRAGLYRLDIPGAALTSTAEADGRFYNPNQHGVVSIKATGCRVEHQPFLLTTTDPNEGVAGSVYGVALGDLQDDDSVGVALNNFLRGYQATYVAGSGVPSGTVGVRLGATGLDGISAADPGTVATTFAQMVVQTWRSIFKGLTISGGFQKTYANDGSTVVTTQRLEIDGDEVTQGAAT